LAAGKQAHVRQTVCSACICVPDAWSVAGGTADVPAVRRVTTRETTSSLTWRSATRRYCHSKKISNPALTLKS
jgi:hypothetical protein